MTQRHDTLPPTSETSAREDVRRFVFEAYMDIALADLLDPDALLERDHDSTFEDDV
ncbi:hypothetical protein [Alicyclobacillus vulcanalis]|uniref:Uncharacterized protein n=1 Tax=Alicyclobacillus vulcanalis TaxID=252246 RepID=A0A1N7NEU6_9BACL|nr:hypothetical protein [Alicyclobacillus vulcanalis]SIS96885.1 hypothetical protein SAMN05421799_10872 [Alicyclobacillus vulcanalis]